ncbi:MAG: DUF2117 domain-containing protein [Methanomicrobiales archaeon]
MVVNDWIMVIHGPEVFDSGCARHLIRVLHPRTVCAVGVMTRTAAEESGLTVEWRAGRPSEVISGLPAPAVLVTQGKTPETGRIFGEQVAGRHTAGGGLVQLDCTAQTVFCWNGGDPDLASRIAAATGWGIQAATANGRSPPHERIIRGCLPGETVCVEGVVIGRAVSDRVVLCQENGVVRAMEGLDPKPHGFEKLASLAPLNLEETWCTSGTLRRSSPRPSRTAPRCGRVAVIDHRGLDLYRRLDQDSCGVLAVGDDTTMVCGHICTHLGVPVFGITDGDGDVLLPGAYPPGSVVVELEGERDDDVGRECALVRPCREVCWDDWVEGTLALLGDRARITVDLRAESDGLRPV